MSTDNQPTTTVRYAQFRPESQYLFNITSHGDHKQAELVIHNGAEMTPHVYNPITYGRYTSYTRLVNLLSFEQMVCFESRGYIDLVGSNGRRYRLVKSTVYNVYCFDTHTFYCLTIDTNRCNEDLELDVYQLLTSQILMITTNESEFIERANRIKYNPYMSESDVLNGVTVTVTRMPDAT